MWTFKRSGAALATLLLNYCLDTVVATEQQQIPLGKTHSESNGRLDPSPWKLNFSSTAPYLFSSVSSLLQQWGNTFFPNGHSIVPCEIPPYTLFYHGRLDGDEPPSPEWLAFDIEMSYGIMGSTRNSHMLTYQTTKPVKALYFDGESATLMGLGQLDTQMLHVFGNVTGPPHDGWGLYNEYLRATGLCDWLESSGLRGHGWGYEGVVRMNAGFEMIWCDFTSPSLRLLTHLNVTAPQLSKEKEAGWVAARNDAGPEESSYYPLPPLPTRTDHSTDPTDPPRPPNWRWEIDREPFLRSQAWGWFSSATNHYGKSRQGPGLGEVRAKVSNCGIMSYYSPRFANLTRTRLEGEQELYNLTSQGHWRGEGPGGNRTTGLAELRRRRRYHHLEDVTGVEALLMRNNSERVLKSLLEDSHECSEADWLYISNEITQNTGSHLKEMTQLLGSFSRYADNETAIESWVSTLRAQSHSFYVAFLEYPTTYESGQWSTESELYAQTYARCRYRYTRLLAPIEGLKLSPEEEDLRWAVEETYGAICSVLLTIGFELEELWAADFREAGRSVESPEKPGERYAQVARNWNDGLEELASWLGWEDAFTGCSEVCQWNERCYIPMWPLMQLGGPPGGRRPPGRGNGTFPGPHYPPPHDGYGGYVPYGGPPHRGPGPPGGGGRDRKRPGGGRGGGFMGDDPELWEPVCASAAHFM